MANHAQCKTSANTENSNRLPSENGAGHAERVLTKLFTEPVPFADPKFPLFLRDSDFLQEHHYKHPRLYSTALWADPLLPFNVTVNGVDSCVNVLPMVGIGTGRHWTKEYSPRLSAWAEKQVQYKKQHAKRLNNLLPICGASKTGVSYLLDKYQGNSTPDEGPFIRLGLLTMLLAPDKWFEHGTSVVKNMVMNGYVKKGSIKRWWSPPVEDSTDTQIGSKQGSSRLYVRSISEYTRMLEGDSEVSIKCDGQSVCPSEVKFIPIKSCWKGFKWLLPFILAHTTTEWWNHALQISLEVAVSKPADEEAKMLIKTIPKASTVYYPGIYKHICLVVVDQDNFHSKIHCSIGGEFEVTYDGNPNFSQYVYQALGRLPSDSPGRSISIDDCNHASKMMEEALSFDLAAVKHPLLLGILSTSRFCGFSVWPSRTHKDNNIRGVMSFNSQEPIQIGNSVARDWSDLLADPEKQQLSEAVKFFTYWRVDPMLQFSKGQVRFRTPQEPLLEEVVKPGHIYSCVEECDEFRILAYAGAFQEIRRNIQKSSFSTFFFDNTIAYGSVMLGLMTWYTAEKGITLFYHNSFKDKPDEFYKEKFNFESLSKLTNGFFQKLHRDDSQEDILSIVGKHLSLEKNWHRVWYSGVIPWWFARAVAEKFGWNNWSIFQVKAQHRPTAQPTANIFDDDHNHIIYGYHMKGSTSENTHLCFITQYVGDKSLPENRTIKIFDIYTPDVTQRRMQTNWISWYYNELNDSSRRDGYELDDEDIVELNTLMLPCGRWPTTRENQAFVSHRATFSCKRDDFTLFDGLQWLEIPDGWCN